MKLGAEIHSHYQYGYQPGTPEKAILSVIYNYCRLWAAIWRGLLILDVFVIVRNVSSQLLYIATFVMMPVGKQKQTRWYRQYLTIHASWSASKQDCWYVHEGILHECDSEPKKDLLKRFREAWISQFYRGSMMIIFLVFCYPMRFMRCANIIGFISIFTPAGVIHGIQRSG